MTYSEWVKENEVIMSIIPYAEDFPLINNYGWEWKYNDIVYNIRHILNVYGCETNYWTYYDSSKLGTPECSKTFSTFDEAVEFLKNKEWERA